MMRFRREAAADVVAVEKAVTDTAVQNLINSSLENEQCLLLSVGFIIVPDRDTRGMSRSKYMFVETAIPSTPAVHPGHPRSTDVRMRWSGKV